jgi:hypothetical protein
MQFNTMLHWVLNAILRADPYYGHIYLIKINITNSFYCQHLVCHQILALRVAIPLGLEGILIIVFPFMFPMGWVENFPTTFLHYYRNYR